MLVTLSALAGILLIVLWWSAGLRPAWWSPIDQASPALRDRATRLENGAVTLMYGGDPATAPATPGPANTPRRFTALVTADDAQAWLNTKMPQWAVAAGHVRRWPAEISDLTLRFENDQLLLGARLQTTSGERFVAALLTPRIDESGQLWITAKSVSIGRLTLPASLLLPSALPPSATAAAEPGAAAMSNALAGRAPLALRPTLQLAGSQVLHLRAISVKDGNLLLECEVEPAPKR